MAPERSISTPAQLLRPSHHILVDLTVSTLVSDHRDSGYIFQINLISSDKITFRVHLSAKNTCLPPIDHAVYLPKILHLLYVKHFCYQPQRLDQAPGFWDPVAYPLFCKTGAQRLHFFFSIKVVEAYILALLLGYV